MDFAHFLCRAVHAYVDFLEGNLSETRILYLWLRRSISNSDSNCNLFFLDITRRVPKTGLLLKSLAHFNFVVFNIILITKVNQAAAHITENESLISLLFSLYLDAVDDQGQHHVLLLLRNSFDILEH